MGYLLLASGILSIRLMRRATAESDPSIKNHMLLTSSFPLCIALAWVMSFIGEAFPVICVCVTVETLCLYIGGTRNEVSMDKLTQVNNRQNLIGYLDYKERAVTGDLYLLMIDVDDFKEINDTFGHIEGDEALINVARILKRACGPFPKRPYIARYGGDEFVIVAELDTSTVDDLKQSIQRELEAVNRERTDYQLHLSIGVVKWTDDMDHKTLIDKADEEMYRIKRAYKLEKAKSGERK